MNITDLPFNHHNHVTENGDSILINDLEIYKNHLGTIHAAAIFMISEAMSGKWIADKLSHLNEITPITRSGSIKYKKPALGQIRAEIGTVSRSLEEIQTLCNDSKMVRLEIKVFVKNSLEEIVSESSFEWILLKKVRYQ